jgi:hypothetical protein
MYLVPDRPSRLVEKIANHMINIPSHHRAPTIKAKITHQKPEIICSPPAKINVGATLAVARLVCSPDIMEEFIIYLASCNLNAM